MAQATGGKRKTYTWNYRYPIMYCFEDPYGGQTITNLWEAAGLTEFHDAALAQGTLEINAILKRVETSNRDPGRKLSFIRVQNRLLLVWARYEGVGADDDEKAVMKALKLKATRKPAGPFRG